MEKRSQSTVRRHYLKWRAEQGKPLRCDNPDCVFHREPLIWNGSPLPLVLDHENGNNSDNRSENLRLLCPHCDSQLETRGGANKGRIQKSESMFAIVGPDDTKQHIAPIDNGQLGFQGYAPTVVMTGRTGT